MNDDQKAEERLVRITCRKGSLEVTITLQVVILMLTWPSCGAWMYTYWSCSCVVAVVFA